ncbi:2-C-methyl-D-erythritol 4-phosphate cytidylyltransferase [Brevibacterium paucivorans]|uniref:2-C-methyl-D-erythritol 4-phosphate cytidylyltransferase n=1 Tax=Brevibacterium paucivorans TaxID=170994 RepID=A0ABS2SIL4_9MICO|nr:2-C-methyl-D-erythritol 4-phosphate cytidylyltransferase [Brevibacterium paucivorans]MBM7816091.1 2-C-methyl-D-erythritol 4-phosphate cytidylyltransferase [Brevibacterium paucivorans]
METVAIIPAAGSGTRLRLETPKAFVPLGGRTLLEHAVAGVLNAGIELVVIAVPRDLKARALDMFRTQPNVQTVIGGTERTESVRNALAAIDGKPTYALVHDAARPLTPRRVFDRVLTALRAGHRNVVPVLPVSDTVRTLTSQQPEEVAPLGAPVERARLRAVQTPQGFTFDDLVAAHDRFARDTSTQMTDDASLLETMGIPSVGVEGSHEAFKITHPLDLELARMLCGRKEYT